MLRCDDCGKLTRELCTVIRHPQNETGGYYDVCRACFDVAELKFSQEVHQPARPFVATIRRCYGSEC